VPENLQLSVIIPAWNEEQELPACLAALRQALAAQPGLHSETIVVDNNSGDRTAELATAAGATVVFEPHNQIARARNAGAHAAGGEWLLFIDADSRLSAALLAELLALAASGRVTGAGSTLAMSGLPWWGRLGLALWNALSRARGWAAGSLLLCRAKDFRALGGFNEAMYAAEEIDLSRRLQRHARRTGQRFLILHRHPLLTSARKLQLYSGREIGAQLLRLALQPRAALRDRSQLGIWYDGRRGPGNRPPADD